MIKDELTIALPKRRLGAKSLELLAKTGLPVGGVEPESRTLQFSFGGVRYLICKPTDVPIYVEYGVADIGIVGKDIIEEEQRNVFKLLDLGFGKCHFAVAAPKSLVEKYEGIDPFPLYLLNYKRVATKFVNVAYAFFYRKIYKWSLFIYMAILN